MTKEEYESLYNIHEIDKPITVEDLEGNIEDRTLLYGYTCDRDTHHVYIKDGIIHTVVYNTVNSVLYEKPDEIREINVTTDRQYLPDKRLYPERCDYKFCELLKKRGFSLPFTTWTDPSEISARTINGKFYGKTLED